jgi:acetyl esterase/lipase
MNAVITTSERESVALWPGTSESVLFVHRAPPSIANGTSVLVCPGGGYGVLTMSYEGHDVAVWLNSLGVTAFVLKYRIAPHRHPGPMQDVQRALRLARSRAAEWKIDPARIGVLGFSAGGHLASTALTHFDDGRKNAADPVERFSSRPDYGVLIYPVIALDKPYTHMGSRKNLLGERETDAALVEDLSTDRRVTPKTPPCFLVHTTEDEMVPPENSVDFYLALRRAGVPAELHIFERGEHGLGMGGHDPAMSTWPNHLATWMRLHGLLGKWPLM